MRSCSNRHGSGGGFNLEGSFPSLCFSAMYQQRPNTSLRNSITLLGSPLEFTHSLAVVSSYAPKTQIPIRFSSFSHTHPSIYCEMAFCLIIIVMLFTPFFVCARPLRVPYCCWLRISYVFSCSCCCLLTFFQHRSDHYFTQPHNFFSLIPFSFSPHR